MTFEAWQTAVLPKVTGTWNFEEALKKQSEPLDFFFLFSSVSGTTGQIGQANYAAGNTFMDAYVQYRRAQNLACSTLAIGIMEDVGFLARERHRSSHARIRQPRPRHPRPALQTATALTHEPHRVEEEPTPARIPQH